MKYSFNITKGSFKEFKLSVSSDPENKVLDRLKDLVKERYEDGFIERCVFIPVKIGSSIDSMFQLVYFTTKEDEAYFRFEYQGTCG